VDIQKLVDKILTDARAEARQIVRDAEVNARENLSYAQNRRDQVISAEKDKAHKITHRKKEIVQGEQDLANRLELLNQKTQIVDGIFERAMGKVKYNFRIENKKDYENRLTREELGKALREQIEAQVVEILFI